MPRRRHSGTVSRHQIRPRDRYNERGQRRCTKCGRWKARSEFGARRDSFDGLRPYCRECARAHDRAVRQRQAVRTRLGYNACQAAAYVPGSPLFWAEVERRLARREGRPVERYDLSARTRLCSCCYRALPPTHEYFGRRASYWDGLSQYCYGCHTKIHSAKASGDVAFFAAWDARKEAHREHVAGLRHQRQVEALRAAREAVREEASSAYAAARVG